MQLSSTQLYQPFNSTQSQSIRHASHQSMQNTMQDTLNLSASGEDKINQAKAIMQNYDIKNMSLNSLEKMSDELRQAGLMSDQEYLMMSRPQASDSNISSLKPLDKDQPINILAEFQQQLQLKQRYGFDSQFIAQDQKRLDTLKFFDSLSN